MNTIFFTSPFPAGTKYDDGFGWRVHPITKLQQFHNGLDVDADRNTPLKNPWKGIVENTGYDDINGNFVVILHHNGYRSGYAHLQKSLVKKGDHLRRGEVFAFSGSSGRATGPHVHLTLTDPHGNKIDPAPVFFASRNKLVYLVILILVFLVIAVITIMNRKLLFA